MRDNGSVQSVQDEPNAVVRRKVLGLLFGLINLSVVATIVAPVLAFIAAPANRRQRAGSWIPVLNADSLQPGETRLVTYRIKVRDGYTWAIRKYNVYLYHRNDGTIVAFDPTCPHLGCQVNFKERKQRYVCPCHGGVFDSDGNKVSGPPPSGLTKLPVRLAEGKIWVQRA